MPTEPLPRGFKRTDILPAALTLATLVLATVLFRFFMVPYELWVNFDEGCEAAAVERIISGHWLPYVDAAAIRGPFLYWTQGIFHVLTGRFEFTGSRVLSLMCALCTVSMTFLAGWAAGWPLAGAIGSATYIFVIAIVFPVGAGMGVVGESVAIAYLTTSFFLVAYALYRARSERGRITLLVLGGAIFGIAGLTKQTQIIACLPIFIWIFARSIGEEVDLPSASPPPPLPWRTILLRRLLPFGAGGLGLLVLVLLRYAIAGQLRTFLYWSMSFGTNIYMKPYHGQVLRLMSQWFIDQPWAILGVVLALAVGVGTPLAAIEARSARSVLAALRDSAFEIAVGLMAAVLLIAALLPLRLWGNYFVLIFPFFGLTVGILIERLLRRGGKVPLLAQGAVVFVVGWLLIVSGVNHLYGLMNERAHGAWGNPRPDPACGEIDRVAGPGREPIFVWGTAGDLYITCQRPSVSMFTSTMIIAGIVAPFWDPNPARVAPGVRETLLRELTTQRPPVLLDHEMAPGATMMDFPFLADFVHREYCRVSTVVDGRGRPLTFYGRKDLEACRGSSP
jgi:hypothetical protein